MLSQSLPTSRIQNETPLLTTVAMYLAAFLPLLMIIGKTPMEIAITLLALMGLFHCFRARKKISGLSLDIRAALLIAAFTAFSSALHGIYTQDSFFGIIWMRFPLAYIGIRVFAIASVKQLRFIALVMGGTLTLCIIDTYWQYATGTTFSGKTIPSDFRLTGPLKQKNIGNFLLKIGFPALGILLFLSASQYHKWRKYVVGLAIVLILLIPLTGERSITLLMLLALSVCGGVALWWDSRLWKKVLSVAFIGLIAAIMLFFTQPFVNERVVFFVEQLGTFPQTPYGQLYNASLQLASAHLFTGVGIKNFLDSCQPLMETNNITYCDIHSHNMYLQLVTETGLVGLLCLCFLVFTCLKIGWQARKQVQEETIMVFAATIALLVVLFFPLIVTQSFFSNWPAALFWYSLAVAMSIIHLLPELNAYGRK